MRPVYQLQLYNFFIHLSVWVSSCPGDVLLGETIWAAVGGVLLSVIAWSCSGELLRLWAGPQEGDSASFETRERSVSSLVNV